MLFEIHMIQTNFYSEYYTFVEQFLSDYTSRLQIKYPNIFKLGDYSAMHPIISFLHLNCTAWGWREIYIKFRKEGKSQREIRACFASLLDTYYNCEQPKFHPLPGKLLKSYDFYREMKTYRKQIVVYMHEVHQLDFIIPMVEAFKQPVVLISELNIPRPDLPTEVTYLRTNIFEKERYSNSFVKRNFSSLFNFFNKFDLLLQIINPSCLILLDGCHYQEQILAHIGKKYAIPTVCIQQQWPLLMNTGFQNMTYDYFLSWGDYFNPIWKKRSRIPKYISVGHASVVVNHTERNKITFFVEPPAFIDEATYYKELTVFIENCAMDSPEKEFWVKEMPGSNLPKEYQKELLAYENVSSANCYPLPEIFSKTDLAVAYFSPVLVESMAHGCIPFILESGLDFVYYPDFEDEGIGLSAPDLSSALAKMRHFIDSLELRDNIREKFERGNANLFKATSYDAIENIVSLIRKIS